jgi:Bifunctional DNA primase/polymerase, N-terminal
MKVDFVAGALPYAEQLGWKVVLLGPQWKLPFVPKWKGGNGVHDASSDPDQIRAWGRDCPDGNIAIACGQASGILALDVDPRNGGDVSIRALAAKGCVFPKGPRAHTGNKGWHLLFQHRSGIAGSKGKIGPGIEVKSTGGYILVAPSWTRPSDDGPGGSYMWEVSPFDVPVPRMPLWLTTMLCPPPRPRPSFRPDARGGDIEHLARFVAGAPQGERNNRLYWASCRTRELVAKHMISEASAVRRLSEAAAAAGLTGADSPKALRTIMSGLRGAGDGHA